MKNICKGVKASDIKAFFSGLSVSVIKLAPGRWKVSVPQQQGAYSAYRYAEYVPRSYSGHSVEVAVSA
jgi:hypothetical protein